MKFHIFMQFGSNLHFFRVSSLSNNHYIFKSMNHPFFADQLSGIHEADTLYDSRLSSLSHLHNQSLFQEQRSFARNTLVGWGMQMGDLPFSKDNQATLRCLVELVGQRQKDLQFRGRVKEDISALQFERDKFRSFAEQAQRAAEIQLKQIGTLQNELNAIRMKIRKGEAQLRKEREQDRKNIAALRTKNEQILHQVKKKEVETARIRQQMKKNVGEKNTPAKNTFDVFIPPKHTEKEGDTQKYAFLLQRNERQLSLAMKENSLLRQKIFQIREALVRFNAWIDKQIFGEQVDDLSPPRAYEHKFYINHNLLFRKESLTEELEALIDVTKDGLTQLREINRGKLQPPKLADNRSEEAELNFKKKPSRREIKTERIIGSVATQNRPNKTSINKRAQGSSQHQQHHSPRSIKHLTQHILTETTTKPSKNGNRAATQTKKVGTVVTRPLPTPISKAQSVPFEDDLLSEVNSGDDFSICSHISIEQMGKSRFDKWDILYQQE